MRPNHFTVSLVMLMLSAGCEMRSDAPQRSPSPQHLTAPTAAVGDQIKQAKPAKSAAERVADYVVQISELRKDHDLRLEQRVKLDQRFLKMYPGNAADRFLTQFDGLLRWERMQPSHSGISARELLLNILRQHEPELAASIKADQLDSIVNTYYPVQPDPAAPRPNPPAPADAQACAQFAADYVQHYLPLERRLTEVDALFDDTSGVLAAAIKEAFGIDVKRSAQTPEDATKLEGLMRNALEKYRPEHVAEFTALARQNKERAQEKKREYRSKN
jgi:hypothetical protein